MVLWSPALQADGGPGAGGGGPQHVLPHPLPHPRRQGGEDSYLCTRGLACNACFFWRGSKTWQTNKRTVTKYGDGWTAGKLFSKVGYLFIRLYNYIIIGYITWLCNYNTITLQHNDYWVQLSLSNHCTVRSLLFLWQGVSWCDDLDFKVFTKLCKPNGHSKYL